MTRNEVYVGTWSQGLAMSHSQKTPLPEGWAAEDRAAKLRRTVTASEESDIHPLVQGDGKPSSPSAGAWPQGQVNVVTKERDRRALPLPVSGEREAPCAVRQPSACRRHTVEMDNWVACTQKCP